MHFVSSQKLKLSSMATAKVQLRAQEARINDQLDHTAEEQEELLNEQLHVQEELTKQDIKEQREAICRLQKDVVDDTTLIGATILKCGSVLASSSSFVWVSWQLSQYSSVLW